MLKVKVLARLADIALSAFVKLNELKSTQKIATRTKLLEKAKVAAKSTAAISEECKQDALNLEMALAEEIAALEQRYDLKHQAVEQKFEDAKQVEFKLAAQQHELNDL